MNPDEKGEQQTPTAFIKKPVVERHVDIKIKEVFGGDVTLVAKVYGCKEVEVVLRKDETLTLTVPILVE